MDFRKEYNPPGTHNTEQIPSQTNHAPQLRPSLTKLTATLRVSRLCGTGAGRAAKARCSLTKLIHTNACETKNAGHKPWNCNLLRMVMHQRICVERYARSSRHVTTTKLLLTPI
eukprot:1271033-Amphidinium_carterae.1